MKIIQHLSQNKDGIENLNNPTRKFKRPSYNGSSVRQDKKRQYTRVQNNQNIENH